ncbi:MAG: zinc-dependent peptidase [Gammaproteobacteria bacterium]|nr:zinc-dependent peptidase [Gammaproteobacteria bacterium]
MLSALRRWREQRIIRRFPYSESDWERQFASMPLLRGLTPDECETLRELSVLFLHRKSLEGAQGLAIDLDMAVPLALQACLPILKLGLDWYNGWVSIVLYPEAFIPAHEEIDEFGVSHLNNEAIYSGESWQHGAVVLAWSEAKQAALIDGHNLLIHEFAHKLDMLNGSANGFPPLHDDMDRAQWTDAFQYAYEDFQLHPRAGIDPYAGTAPAEFFAVISEVFFERPDIVDKHYPRVYVQLKRFYRQDPLTRLGKSSGVRP